MILAAAEQQKARYLLTEDLTQGQVVAGVEIVNPFAWLVKRSPWKE